MAFSRRSLSIVFIFYRLITFNFKACLSKMLKNSPRTYQITSRLPTQLYFGRYNNIDMKTSLRIRSAAFSVKKGPVFCQIPAVGSSSGRLFMSSENEKMDKYFSTLVNGKNTLPSESLLSSEDFGKLDPALFSDISYKNFSFEIKSTMEKSSKSKARTGIIKTPHGEIKTPNFVFCATKASMKAMTSQQLKETCSQVILSNTYHLMLTPGSATVEKLGGLQKMTGWNGPMLTDSGGYQIFSMGFGSVSNEIKGKRNTASMGWNKTLISVDEEGATFKSFVDGSVHHLTPEKSMEVQRQLGADLVVVLDECTPFHVTKNYTEASMLRSHRWALRCLNAFKQTHSDRQALYGIVQGGVYRDLRERGCAFVNSMPFFGIAIGGSLGAKKQEMHEIVNITRAMLRNDRPIHLLGIGGVRDVFYGVRQGIDTFDCVHPSRLARHGGALVKASHWDNESPEANNNADLDFETSNHPMIVSFRNKRAKVMMTEKNRLHDLELALSRVNSMRMIKGDLVDAQFAEREKSLRQEVAACHRRLADVAENLKQKARNALRSGYSKAGGSTSDNQQVREHISLRRGAYREDPRPLDSTCECYTCRTASRGYLHHLFKTGESLGGTLVTIHNVHFMNKMMADIRTGIEQGNLDEVEREYVHPNLVETVDSTGTISQ